MRPISMLIAASVLFSAGANADEPTLQAQAALTGLKRLLARPESDPRLEEKKLKGLRKLGFAAKEEVFAAELADPVQVYMVRLDKLRAYRAGTDDPAGLLNAVDSQIYPIRVDRTAKASVFIEGGKLSGYGSPHLTQKLELVRAQLLEQTRLPERSFFLVQVPALNVRLLGHYQSSKQPTISPLPTRSLTPSIRTAAPAIVSPQIVTRKPLVLQPKLTKRLMLTPLHDVKLPIGDREDRYASLAQGKTLAADVVFRTLLQSAKNLDVSVPH